MDGMFSDELPLPLDSLTVDWLTGQDLLDMGTNGSPSDNSSADIELVTVLGEVSSLAQPLPQPWATTGTQPILLRPVAAKGPASSRFRCTGPPSKAARTLCQDVMPRLVTTGAVEGLAKTIGDLSLPLGLVAPLPAAKQPCSSPATSVLEPASHPSPHSSAVKSNEGDSDSEDSIDTDDAAFDDCKPNKRKAAEVDWRSITDPAERRRQRRLAKNRLTAAKSRERKKEQWAEMEAKLNALEVQNQKLKALLEAVTSDNSSLRQQLGQLVGPSQGCQSSVPLGAKEGSSTEPAVLIYIAIMLLLCAILPGDQVGIVLGASAPLLLAAIIKHQQEQSRQLAAAAAAAATSLDTSHAASLSSTSAHADSGGYLLSALLHFMLAITHVLAKCNQSLQRAIHRTLFKRHHFSPPALRSAWAQFSVSHVSMCCC